MAKYSSQIANQQAQLNATNFGRVGFTPLKVDGLLGPLTQAALTQFGPTNNVPMSINPNVPTGPIPTSALGAQPLGIQAPANVNTAQTNLGINLASLGGQMQTSQQQAQNATVTPVQTNSRQTIYDSLVGLIGKQGQKAERTDQLYQENNVQALQENSRNIENKYLSNQKAFADKVKEVRKNSSGMTEQALNANLQEMERNFNSDQANIAINYKIANGAYTDAANLVQDKIKAEFEGIDNQISSITSLANLMQNDLSESEKLQVQAQLQEKQDLKKTYATIIQNAVNMKAPPSVLSALDAVIRNPNATTADLYQAAGQYAVDESAILDNDYKRAQIKKLKSESSGSSGGGALSPLTQSVIDNPSLFDDLTPTVKGQVLSQLQAQGYDTSNLGVKALSDTAIEKISAAQSAIEGLDELKLKLKGNEKFLGPIKGIQKLNPFSKARSIQADVDRIRQTVGKALEGGVLRKEDEEKYKKILATLNDTPETAYYKVDALMTSIQRDVENYKALQSAGGRSADVGASLNKKGSTQEDLRSKYSY